MGHSMSRINVVKNRPSYQFSEREDMDESLKFSVIQSDNTDDGTDNDTDKDTDGDTDNSTDNQNYFSLLPKEMILYIFKFLSIFDLRICAMVSKLWHVMSFSAELWTNVFLSSMCIEISFLERILNCCVKTIYFESLQINMQKPIVHPLFETQSFNSLKSITVHYKGIRLELVEELLGLTPNLQKIELFSYDYIIGSNFFRKIVKLRLLEQLNLRFHKIEHIPEIVKIFKKSGKSMKLKTLSFSTGYPNIVWSSEQSKILLENLLRLCPNLEVLNLPDKTLNNETFRYILDMHHLKDLNITNSTIDANVIPPHLKKCKKWINLQNLNISRTNMSKNIQMLLLNLSPNLESLNIDGNIKVFVFEQIMNMKRLKNLNFSNAVLKFKKNLRGDKTWINLQKLDIMSAHMPENIKFFLLNRSPNLEFLHIEGLITHSIFEQIVNMKKIQNLHFSGADLKVLNDFKRMKKFDKLRFLRIFKNTTKHYRTHFLNKLLACCEKLQELTLSGFGIDQGIFREILKMKNLEKLYLSDIKKSLEFGIQKHTGKYIKLNKLKRVSLIFGEPRTNPICAETILLSCNNLTNLELRISFITERMWRCILSMKDLESLFLYDLEIRDYENIPKINNLLKFLNLKILYVNYIRRQVKPRRLETLLTLCPNVQDLYLRSTYLTDSIFKSIASMKELKALHLTSVFGFSKEKMEDILTECPKLTKKKIQIFNF